MKKTLIFIPAYNVEKFIFKLFERIPVKIFKNNNINFLIINDNSTDRTQNEIKKIKSNFKYKIKDINLSKNIGYGGVQKLAFDFAIKKKFKYCVMLHGDGQYTPKKLPKILKLLKSDNYDAVFGSRMKQYKSAIQGGMPIYKFLGNILLTKLQNLILSSNLSEFHSGYRSFKTDALKKINYRVNTNSYHFDTEIIIKLLSKNLKIHEVHIPTIYGEQISHLKSIPYGLNTLFTTIKFRLKR